MKQIITALIAILLIFFCSTSTAEWGAPTTGESVWQATRFDWTTGDLDYKGVNTNVNALVTDSDWQIKKYTWAGGNVTLIQGPLKGVWNTRDTLGW